jgi:hypothetical protein
LFFITVWVLAATHSESRRWLLRASNFAGEEAGMREGEAGLHWYKTIKELAMGGREGGRRGGRRGREEGEGGEEGREQGGSRREWDLTRFVFSNETGYDERKRRNFFRGCGD